MSKDKRDRRDERRTPSNYMDKPGAKELVSDVASMNTAMKLLSVLLKVVLFVVLYIGWKGYQADKKVKKFKLKQESYDNRTGKSWR